MGDRLSTKSLYGVLSVTIIGVLFVGVAYNQGWFHRQPNVQNAKLKNGSQDPDSKALQQPAPDGFRWVGGVLRPITDIQERKPLELPKIGAEAIGKRMGRSPVLEPDTNPNTRSVAEALQNPSQYPERLNPLFPAKDFDPDAFRADPESYLSVVEPGRIWQSLPRGDGVKSIKRRSPLYQNVIQGETVSLRVQAAPASPVTFHSFDLGHFTNSLTTISVQADGDGIASVDFTASTGTFGELNILASSPQNSGQANFVVNVSLPALVANTNSAPTSGNN